MMKIHYRSHQPTNQPAAEAEFARGMTDMQNYAPTHATDADNVEYK